MERPIIPPPTINMSVVIMSHPPYDTGFIADKRCYRLILRVYVVKVIVYDSFYLYGFLVVADKKSPLKKGARGL